MARRRKSLPAIDAVRKRFDAAWANRSMEYIDAIVEALEEAHEFPVTVELGADFGDRERLFEMLEAKGFAVRMADVGVIELSDPDSDEVDEVDDSMPEPDDSMPEPDPDEEILF